MWSCIWMLITDEPYVDAEGNLNDEAAKVFMRDMMANLASFARRFR